MRRRGARVRLDGGIHVWGFDRALFRMSALRAPALAIDEFLNDLALGGAPAGDNLLTALGANSYFVGARFEHEGRRG
jgi:hypothetical protein